MKAVTVLFSDAEYAAIEKLTEWQNKTEACRVYGWAAPLSVADWIRLEILAHYGMLTTTTTTTAGTDWPVFPTPQEQTVPPEERNVPGEEGG